MYIIDHLHDEERLKMSNIDGATCFTCERFDYASPAKYESKSGIPLCHPCAAVGTYELLQCPLCIREGTLTPCDHHYILIVELSSHGKGYDKILMRQRSEKINEIKRLIHNNQIEPKCRQCDESITIPLTLKHESGLHLGLCVDCIADEIDMHLDKAGKLKTILSIT